MLDMTRDRERARQFLSGFVSKLQREADDRVSTRMTQEAVWLDDLRAYYQYYDTTTWRGLTAKGRESKSKVNMNKAGVKTRVWISRLHDMLFPTDDKNWGIEPTPVPALSRQADAAVKQARTAEQQAQAEFDASGGQVQPQTAQATVDARAVRDRLLAVKAEADDRCRLMSDEMDDQLTETGYAAACRDVIEDACKLGTGITEGPIIDGAPRKRWGKVPIMRARMDPATGEPMLGENGEPLTEETGEHEYQLQEDSMPRPSYRRVDPWNFFPSKGATCIEDSEGFFVRYPWTAQQVRQFARYPNVDIDAVREILKNKRMVPAPGYVQRLADLTPDQTATVTASVHMVWKYVGPIDAEDLGELAFAMGDLDLIDGDPDPLDEVHVIIWFCDGMILKVDPYPLDSGKPLFTRFCFEKSVGFWGFGVPWLIRNPDRCLTAAWRLMMDNSEVSSMPQIAIDTNRLKPQNASYVLTGGKIWVPKTENANIGWTGNEFQSFEVQSNQALIANIIEMASAAADEFSMLPPQAMGDIGGAPQETAQGMALWLNFNNVLLKRVVTNYDDDKTKPEIANLYDWNMQFGTRDEIKGDYRVVPKGAAVLLVREMQQRNVSMIALNFGGHPTYAPMLKDGGYPLFAEVFRSCQLSPDQFIMSADDWKAQQSAPPPDDPAIALQNRKLDIDEAKLDVLAQDSETRAQIANMESDTKRTVAQLNYQAAMEAAAARYNSEREHEAQDAANKAAERRARDRSVAFEAALRARPEAPLNETRIDN